MKMVLVSAVALVDVEGRVLLAQRPEGKSMAGLWEFPGGKIDAGEGARAALVREIEEECGLSLDPGAMREAAFAADDPCGDTRARPILLLLYHCPSWSGRPISREGGEWQWFAPQRIAQLEKPPLDRQLCARFFG